MEIDDRKQWHPAFCAAIELEFKEDREALLYEREYNLSKKPLQIDLLIVKKETNVKLKNEIGEFFLGHNIIEYKSPGDSLTIDDLYKVLGYACIYKSETGGLNEILDTDITISLIRENKPDKLLSGLYKKYKVENTADGIYHVDGMIFPIQIVVTDELNPKLHTWLHSLTRSIEHTHAEALLYSYEDLKNDIDKENADVVIDFVSNVNEDLFIKILEEDKYMTEKLKILVAPELVNLRLVVANKDAEIANKEAEIASNKAEIASNKAEIASNKAEIANKEAEIASNKAEIANKDAEIVKLKKELLKYTKQD